LVVQAGKMIKAMPQALQTHSTLVDSILDAHQLVAAAVVAM
jgi:hypothetical protein